MQLIQLVLKLQLMSLSVAGSAVEKASSPVPGLLPAPGGRQPAGLQHTRHVTKELLLQPLHALLHLADAEEHISGAVCRRGPHRHCMQASLDQIEG